MEYISQFEFIGSVLAVIGTYLLAMGNKASKYGWLAYFVSSTMLLAVTHNKGLTSMTNMYTLFSIINAYGIYTHFLKGEKNG